MKAIYVINKIDQITLEELNILDKLPNYCPICAYHEWNLDGLVEMIWEYLDLVNYLNLNIINNLIIILI